MAIAQRRLRDEPASLEHDLIRFSIIPVCPIRLDLTAWALRRRPGNRTDLWDGETYRRVLIVGDSVTLISVKQRRKLLDVTIAGNRLLPTMKRTVTSALERLLGIRVDLSTFYKAAARDPRLNRLAERFRGLKPPRFPTVF